MCWLSLTGICKAPTQLLRQIMNARHHLSDAVISGNLSHVPQWQLRQVEEYDLGNRRTLPFTEDVHEQLLAYVQSSFKSCLLLSPGDRIARIRHLCLEAAYGKCRPCSGIVMRADGLLNFMSQQPVQVAGAVVAALPALPLRVIVCLLWHQLVRYELGELPDYSLWLCDPSLMHRLISEDRSWLPNDYGCASDRLRIGRPDGRTVMYIIQWTPLTAVGPHTDAVMS